MPERSLGRREAQSGLGKFAKRASGLFAPKPLTQRVQPIVNPDLPRAPKARPRSKRLWHFIYPDGRVIAKEKGRYTGTKQRLSHSERKLKRKSQRAACRMNRAQ